MKRAVFFDVDGTILDSMNGAKRMTPAVTEAIHKLKEEGSFVFVATGRPYAFISEYLHDFGFDGFLLSNGAQVIMNGKTIFKDPMDKAFVKHIVSKFDEHGIEYILEGSHESYLKEHHAKFHSLFEGTGIDNRLIKSEYDIEAIDVFKIEVLCDGPETEKILMGLMAEFTEYEYFFSISQILFEIHAKKNTKATGIMKTLELLDIPVENSYAFGDGCNDIEMLQAAGCGIAMGNASDEVKAYADEVTETVANDGVAIGIEKYILGSEDEWETACS